jgi:hypothetical protein
MDNGVDLVFPSTRPPAISPLTIDSVMAAVGPKRQRRTMSAIPLRSGDKQTSGERVKYDAASTTHQQRSALARRETDEALIKH